MEAQSVVVIQDASKEVNPRVFDWAIKRLSLKLGDKLTLVAILQQITTPMGYKNLVDSSSMVGANERIIGTQVAWKKEEYLNNEELVKIIKQYESKQVEFNIEVVAGPSPKEVALRTAKNLKATWVVLDRQKKKVVDFFLQMLSCGISKLINKNQIEHLRGPPPTEIQCSQDVESVNSEDIQDNPFGREVSPWNKIDNDQQSLQTKNIQNSPRERESRLAIVSNQTTGQTKVVSVSPCLVDNQESHVIKDSSAEKSNLTCGLSLGTNSQSNEESLADVTISQGNETLAVDESTEDTSARTDKETKFSHQESENHITCAVSIKETEETKSLSTKIYKKSERSIFSGGARNFFLGDSAEYLVDEQFFI